MNDVVVGDYYISVSGKKPDGRGDLFTAAHTYTSGMTVVFNCYSKIEPCLLNYLEIDVAFMEVESELCFPWEDAMSLVLRKERVEFWID